MNQKTIARPSRRTVIRTAAWTAPAVSLVVAAPAYATGSTPPCVWAVSSSSVNSGNGTWSFHFDILTGSGSTVSGVTAVAKFAGNVKITSFSPTSGWTISPSAGSSARTWTFTHVGDITAATTLDFIATCVDKRDIDRNSSVCFTSSNCGTKYFKMIEGCGKGQKATHP